jgi:pantothenate kinase
MLTGPPTTLDPRGIEVLTDELCAALPTPPRRLVVGIAGVPGSGKSTLASVLAERVNERSPRSAVVLPMDGFHLSNAQLSEMNLRDRKGSPPTFDAAAFVTTLQRASQGECFAFPVYDRALHEPVVRDEPAQSLSSDTQLVITEGNYLLLDESPWSELATVLRQCWLLQVPLNVAMQRLVARHVAGGRSHEDALAHCRRNDEPNAALVLNQSRRADRVLVWPAE